MLLGERDGDLGGELGVDLVDLEIGQHRDAELAPERLQHVLLGREAHLHQHLAQASAFLGLLNQGLLERVDGDAPGAELEQDLAYGLVAHRTIPRAPGPVGPER